MNLPIFISVMQKKSTQLHETNFKTAEEAYYAMKLAVDKIAKLADANKNYLLAKAELADGFTNIMQNFYQPQQSLKIVCK